MVSNPPELIVGSADLQSPVISTPKSHFFCRPCRPCSNGSDRVAINVFDESIEIDLLKQCETAYSLLLNGSNIHHFWIQFELLLDP